MKCEVCNGQGTYPIISVQGSHLYDIRCPECFGTGDEEIKHKNTDDQEANSDLGEA